MFILLCEDVKNSWDMITKGYTVLILFSIFKIYNFRIYHYIGSQVKCYKCTLSNVLSSVSQVLSTIYQVLFH